MEEALEKAFKRIHKKDNDSDDGAEDDIDMEEWITFLTKLGVELDEEEMKTMFSMIREDDSEQYIEKNEIIVFLTQKFESAELRRYQDAIHVKVGFILFFF